MIRSTLSSIGAQALPKVSINQVSPMSFRQAMAKDYQVAFALVRSPLCQQIARTETGVCYIRGIEAAGRAGVV